MAGFLSDSFSLIFDADDTLWDSNVHFLEAFDEFVEAFAAVGLSVARDAIKSALRVAELDLIQTHGYGRGPYVMALHRAATELASVETLDALRCEIDLIGSRLIERHCELLPGVEETLVELGERHTLMLFTKAQRDEQMRKLQRTGLDRLFSRIETPREKDVDAYRRLVRDASLDASRTWMIGNSPRSDINPAVRAGLRAVYIPYPHTWELEHEEIEFDERIVELSSFRGLLDLF
jgi:putative hydrolase of the HAD superfamily